jgi:hypothetical protein
LGVRAVCSARRRDRCDLGECGGQRLGPGPGGGDAESSASLAVGEPCRDVQQSVAQRLGFGLGQVAGQCQEAEPGGQVGGDRDQQGPGLVDLELPGGEPSEPGVFGVPDAVLDAAWARCRASRNASCPPEPGGVFVATAW